MIDHNRMSRFWSRTLVLALGCSLGVALVLLALWSRLPQLGAWLAQGLLVLCWSLAALSLLGLLVLVGRALGSDQMRFRRFSQAIAVVGGGVGWCLLGVLVSQSVSTGQPSLVG